MDKIKKDMLKKSFFWARICGHLPGVMAIFLSGSVSQNKFTKDSDIDFFVIAKNGKIWTARFFIFFILKIFGQLAKEKNHAQKICPNHFITNKNLEIKEQDFYSANLFMHNIPLYDPKNLFSKFITKNESWIKKIIPNKKNFFEDLKNNFSKIIEKRFGSNMKFPILKKNFFDQNNVCSSQNENCNKLNFSKNTNLPKNKPLLTEIKNSTIHKNYFFRKKKLKKTIFVSVSPHKARASKKSLLENFLKKIQTRKIKKNKEYYAPGAKIILSNDELRFHPKPKNLAIGSPAKL